MGGGSRSDKEESKGAGKKRGREKGGRKPTLSLPQGYKITTELTETPEREEAGVLELP